MPQITIKLEDSLFSELQRLGNEQRQTVEELLRKIVIDYVETHSVRVRRSQCFLDIPPLSLGRMLKPVGTSSEILDEMLRLRDGLDDEG